MDQAPEGFRQTTRQFFERDVLDVAPELLGALLMRTTPNGTVGLRITEVEAYAGERDPAAHSYRGKTARNKTMFGPAGHIYCYFTYGLHHAINLVCTEEGKPYGCLIRAGEVVIGAPLARQRREQKPRKHPIPDWNLARGPGNVAESFGVDLGNDGDDLFSQDEETPHWNFYVPDSPNTFQILTGSRIGVNSAGADPVEFSWRYWLPNDLTVSAKRTPTPEIK